LARAFADFFKATPARLQEAASKAVRTPFCVGLRAVLTAAPRLFLEFPLLPENIAKKQYLSL
jgi:hypothetical protein